MKNILIILILLMLPVCLTSQDFAVDKGSIGFGGGLGYVSMTGDLYEDVNGDGMTVISISPNLLYFVVPNIGIGVQFGYTSTSWGDVSWSTFGVGPQIAYFIGDADQSIFPFISASYNF